MSSKTQVIPAEPEVKRHITRQAYRFFIAGAGLLLMGAIALAVSIYTNTTPPASLTAIFTGIACLGSAGLVLGVMTLFRLRQRVQVEVTPLQLIWREGQRLATLEFDEVERVELVRDRLRRPSGRLVDFPVVRFVENDGEMMEFEVSFDDNGVIHNSRFDAHEITQAVLPHVRDHAAVTPAVDEFVKTGYIDVDKLPKR
jgi:hypothetical protein